MYAVEMRGITKRFPGMIANDQIEFLVEKGEIHSLLGENGAGKTTLMKILFGLYQPDGGSIKINGNEIKHQTAGYGCHGFYTKAGLEIIGQGN